MVCAIVSGHSAAVLHEARSVGDLVVKLHRIGVGFVGEPVDTRCAVLARSVIHVLDQLAPAAALAKCGIDEEVLQITVIALGPG